jgi:hypothetical protein
MRRLAVVPRRTAHSDVSAQSSSTLWPLGAVVLLLPVLLSGCADMRPTWTEPSLARPDRYYARSDLEEILRFGADMARKSPSSRAEECQSLLKQFQVAPGTGVRLHLLTGRLLSDACGDVRKVIAAADEIPPAALRDPLLRWLVAAQVETLKRQVGNATRKPHVVERRYRSAPAPAKGSGASQKTKPGLVATPPPRPESVPSPKKEEPAGAKGEAKVLRDKLEAIRDLERKLDAVESKEQ